MHGKERGHDEEPPAETLDNLQRERAVIDRLTHVGHGGGELLKTATILVHDHVPQHRCAEVGVDVYGTTGNVVVEDPHPLPEVEGSALRRLDHIVQLVGYDGAKTPARCYRKKHRALHF